MTFADEPVHVRRGETRRQEHVAHPPHIQEPLIQRVVDQLGGGPPAPSTGETALRTTVLMERVLAGASAG